LAKQLEKIEIEKFENFEFKSLEEGGQPTEEINYFKSIIKL
jgi:hypothetical protein